MLKRLLFTAMWLMISAASFSQVGGPGTVVVGGGGSGSSGPATELGSPVVIEGTTADAFEGNFTFADPTADWTWAWGAAGDLVGAGSLSIDNLKLDGNTLSATDSNGNIILSAPGTGSVKIPNVGACSTPSLVVGSDDDTGWYNGSSGFMSFCSNGVLAWYEDSQGRHIMNGSGFIDFNGTSLENDNTADGVLRISEGGYGNRNGWLTYNGKKALASDFTSTSATPANLTGLSTTLIAGRKYTFRMALRFSNSTASDGLRVDFDGGAATATDFGVNCQVYDTALLLSQDTTALATDVVATTTTGASSIKCDGSFVVNAAGTFIPRAGQEAAGGGTLTVEVGSYLDITDASFN